MRFVFIKKLAQMAESDKTICILTPDMGYGILDQFRDKFPERYFNLGICEQNCISVAAGMAINGLKPYVYSIIPFIVERCFEQIRVDVSYMRTNVKIVGVGAGFEYGSAGATHHGTEDMAVLRSLPHMNIFSPATANEMTQLLELSWQSCEPSYIRIARHNFREDDEEKISIGIPACLKKGSGIALLATGRMVYVAREFGEILEKNGKRPSLFSIHTLKPVNDEAFQQIFASHPLVITFEEHTVIGGLFSLVAELNAKFCGNNKIIPFGMDDRFSHVVGSADFIRDKFNLSLERIMEKCSSLIS